MGNTVDNIMDSCSEIPEFTIIKGPNAAKLILDSKDGAGEELFATVFPGVTLGYIDIGASSCPDAAPAEEDVYKRQYYSYGSIEYIFKSVDFDKLFNGFSYGGVNLSLIHI